jgi:hypothetical protein
MPAAIQHIVSVLLLPLTAIFRLVRPHRRALKRVDAAYMARVAEAERQGDDAFLDRELAKRQPTAESLRGSAAPSPTDARWPAEDLHALFGPEIADSVSKPTAS